MDYTSMGARGKYSSENNLWSRPWSASQPSSRRGSEQSVKDGSNVPRRGVVSEDNTDITKIGASIESLRRDGELSMGAPPPLTDAFSGSVSNFTHQNSSNVKQGSRRGSRRSITDGLPGLSADRTVDINGDEGQSASASRSAGNLSLGSTLGAALGSRSLHKQKSGEVHVSAPPGLSSINDVSSSAEELASSANVNQNSGDASSLLPNFTLKQSTNDMYRSTPPAISSQQDMTASIDDTPANATSYLQPSQQGGGGVGEKAKSPFASRSKLQKSTEALQSRNDLKQPPGYSSAHNTNGAPGTSSLQTPQREEKKTKSPNASRASSSTDVLASEVSNQPSRRESELRPPPGVSSTQGSSGNVDESRNKSGSAAQSMQHGSGKSKNARASGASIHKGSALQINGNEQFGDFTATQSFADVSSPNIGYVPSYAQPSRANREVRGGEKVPANHASKSTNLGSKDTERSVASVAPGPSRSAFDLRSKETVERNGKVTSSTPLLKNEENVRIEGPPVTSISGHATLGPKREVAGASATRSLANKSVSIGGITSVGNSASNLVGGSRSPLSASEQGSTNSLKERYGVDESEGGPTTETREDAGKAVEPAFDRSYAFALKWDPYTLRVKCEHKGETRLAYLPIRKILDEQDDSCTINDTFQKLFSDSIHYPDIFDPSRHFLAFLDADGDWCTLGDTPEDFKVFVESSKFDPMKAGSRVARLKSFDLSILEDLSQRESTDTNEEEDESPHVGTSRRQSQGSVKSATSVGERSGGRKLMPGNPEDRQEVLRKDSFGSSILWETTSTAFAFPNEAFSFQQSVFLGWLVGAAPMAVAVRHSEFWMSSYRQTEEYHREEPWYDCTTFALGMSMLLSFIGYVRANTVDKQRLGLALLCVNAISFSSYLSIIAGLTPAVSDILNRPLEIVRYMDWAFTCPTLILLIGQLTRTEGNIRRAMIVNVVMIAARFFGSCLPWSYGLPFSAASFGCFGYLMSDIWRWWSVAVTREKAIVDDRRNTKGSIGVESLVHLQILSTTSSVMYPIIWLLGILDVICFEEGEVLYCVADALAKVVFTMIVVSNWFEYSRSATAELESDTTVARTLSGKSVKSTSSLNPVGQREPSFNVDTFDAATVFSCDIVGYTAMVDRFTPNNRSKTLHNLWKQFESVARVYHIYKVESKGGAFLGVAGAPDHSSNHAEQAAEFALNVLQMVEAFTTKQNKKGEREKIRLRIGLHTGPLSVGIVDGKSISHGIFGDTVTTAGQLEVACVPMCIHVSEEVYKALEGKGFEFEACESMEEKGEGMKKQTYFLVGKRQD